MKTLLTLAILALLTASSFAATNAVVIFDYKTFMGAGGSQMNVVMQPSDEPRTNGTSIITGEAVTRKTTTAGIATFTNVFWGTNAYYRVDLQAPGKVRTVYILVPTNTTQYAADLLVTTVGTGSVTAGYSQAQANAAFIAKNNGVGTNTSLYSPRLQPGSGTSNQVWSLTNATTGQGEWRTAAATAGIDTNVPIAFSTNVSVGGTFYAGTGSMSDLSASTLTLDSPLEVMVGGTGRSNLTAGTLLVGNGTNPPSLLSGSSAGHVATWNGSAWVSSNAPSSSGSNGITTTISNLMDLEEFWLQLATYTETNQAGLSSNEVWTVATDAATTYYGANFNNDFVAQVEANNLAAAGYVDSSVAPKLNATNGTAYGLTASGSFTGLGTGLTNASGYGYLPTQTTTNFAVNTTTGNGKIGNVGATNGGLWISGSSSDSTLKVGSIEAQGFDVNNAFIGENIYYASGFKRRAAGLGSLLYFQNGTANFATAPNSTAGSAATMSYRMVVNNTGWAGFGGQSDDGVGAVAGLKFVVSPSGFATNTGSLTITTNAFIGGTLTVGGLDYTKSFGALMLGTNWVRSVAGTGSYYGVSNYNASVGVNMTANQAIGTLSNHVAGYFSVNIDASFNGQNSQAIEVALFTNNVECSVIEFNRTLGAAATIGSAAACGMVYLPANSVSDVRLQSTSGTGNVTFSKIGFNLIRQ